MTLPSVGIRGEFLAFGERRCRAESIGLPASLGSCDWGLLGLGVLLP